MPYKVRYLPLFWDDLDDTVHYIARVLRAPLAAERLVDELEREILSHAEHPMFGTAYVRNRTTDQGADQYYWFPVGNYMAFYVVIADTVEMRRFLYGSRDLTRVRL